MKLKKPPPEAVTNSPLTRSDEPARDLLPAYFVFNISNWRPSAGKAIILNTWSLFARGHGSETGFWNRDVLNPTHRLSAVHRAGPEETRSR